jgi:hypothetical protein
MKRTLIRATAAVIAAFAIGAVLAACARPAGLSKTATTDPLAQDTSAGRSPTSSSRDATHTGTVALVPLRGGSGPVGDVFIVRPAPGKPVTWLIEVTWGSRAWFHLDRYDPKTGSVARTVSPFWAQPQPSYFKVAAEEDSTGRIWISTTRDFGYVRETTGRFTRVSLPPSDTRAPAPADGESRLPPGRDVNSVEDMALGDDGHVYVARSYAHDLLEYDPARRLFTSHGLPAGFDWPQGWPDWKLLHRAGGFAFYDPGLWDHSTPRRNVYYAFDTASGRFSRLAVPGPAAASDGMNVWFETRVLGFKAPEAAPLEILPPGVTSALPRGLGVPHTRGSVMAVDRLGDVFSRSNETITSVNVDTGVAYRWRIPVTHYRNPHPLQGFEGTVPPPGDTSVYTNAPEFRDRCLDGSGDLWVTYSQYDPRSESDRRGKVAILRR